MLETSSSSSACSTIIIMSCLKTFVEIYDLLFSRLMVVAKSVNVRAKDRKLSKSLFVAHNAAWYKAHGMDFGNDTFPLIDIAPSGWYHIMTVDGGAYITNKEKYTRLVEE